MKTIICSFFIGVFFLSACDSKKSDSANSADAKSTAVAEADAQSTADGAAKMIFDAAKSGDYSKLKGLCNASLEADTDSKKVCEVADGDEELKSMFKEHFSKGKVVGSPTIEGDEAKVNIMFGPDGTKEETFSMKKKDGKWYLVSF